MTCSPESALDRESEYPQLYSPSESGTYLLTSPLHAILIHLNHVLMLKGREYTAEELAARGVDVEFILSQVRRLD